MQSKQRNTLWMGNVANWWRNEDLNSIFWNNFGEFWSVLLVIVKVWMWGQRSFTTELQGNRRVNTPITNSKLLLGYGFVQFQSEIDALRILNTQNH